MSRDFVYSFAGCVMHDAPFVTPFQPCGEPSARGISSAGVLELLAGREINLEVESRDKLRARRPDLPPHYGHYGPINVETIKAICWTPVTDAAFLIPSARCHDRTFYPINDGEINEAIGSTRATLPMNALRGFWRELHATTLGIPHRFLVVYPTDHMEVGSWKDRIDWAQKEASQLLYDWTCIVIRPELETPGGYWAHYSQRAKEELWAKIVRDLV